MDAATATRLRDDLEFFAKNVLKILPKSGGAPAPFVFNKAQMHLHKCLENQRKLTGKVRALVLKGRQQGISTYVGARYYHKTVTTAGTLTAIFAHDSSASDSLYTMVNNYYDLSPAPMQPTLGAKNARELLFPKLKSGYKVGTAGSTGLGRGKTLHRVHWSEVAYSPSPDEHAAGILQAVPDAPDTEIILESTANGEGDYFYRACMAALSGQSDYQLVFLPWYWQPEYSRPITDGFDPDEQEQLYLDLYARDGLTIEHLNWRRSKIREFGGDVTRFKHEYPFSVEEAFEASDTDSYIKAADVKAARNRPPRASNTAPLVFGVDPAALGQDKFVVCHRNGDVVTQFSVYPKGYPHEQAQRLALEIQKFRPHRVCIDAGGLGIGVIGCLRDLGHGDIISKVDFGGAALEAENNYNKTAEMFRRAKDWLESGQASFICDDKDAAAVQSELSSRRHTWHNNTRLKMESKADYKKRLTYSPDKADAFLLTFADILAQTTQFMGRVHQPIIASTSNWDPFA